MTTQTSNPSKPEKPAKTVRDVIRECATMEAKGRKKADGFYTTILADCIVDRGIVETKLAQCKEWYEGDYIAALNVLIVKAADVKTGRGTQEQAELYAATMKSCRSTWGMGVLRAKRAATKAGTLKAPADAPAQDEATTDAPAAPSVVHKIGDGVSVAMLGKAREVRERLLHFVTTHGAKLDPDATEDIGKLSHAFAELYEMMAPDDKGAHNVPTAPDAPKGDDKPADETK